MGSEMCIRDRAVLETTAQAYDLGFELGTSVRDEVDGRITFDV